MNFRQHRRLRHFLGRSGFLLLPRDRVAGEPTRSHILPSAQSRIQSIGCSPIALSTPQGPPALTERCRVRGFLLLVVGVRRGSPRRTHEKGNTMHALELLPVVALAMLLAWVSIRF